MGSIKLPHASGNSMSIAAPATNPASDLELKLPATIGSANQVVANSAVAGTLAFANLPINEFDYWYLTDHHTSNGVISSDLIRNNQDGYASQIGTGMSESSGVFTFPSTGKWLVIANAVFECNDSDSIFLYTNVTTNNSAYAVHAYACDGNNGSGTRRGSGCSFSFIDVTDTSQVKVKFEADSVGTSSYVRGGTAKIETGFIFIRLGDT